MMMSAKKIVLLLIVIMMVVPSVMAQRRKIERADDAFQNYKYNVALERYKKVLPKLKKKKYRSEQTRVSWQIAECYRLKNDSKRAEPSYRSLVRRKGIKKDSLLYLRYADALLQNGKTEKALEFFTKFHDSTPDDPRGKLGMDACLLLEEWTINPGKFEVNAEKRISTRFDEFGVSYGNRNLNEIIFASSREEAFGKKTDDWTGNKFTDLFITKKDKKGKWVTPVLLDESELINTEANEGTPAMGGRFTTLYFTRCSKLSNRSAGCKVYSARRQGKIWAEPVEVNLGGDTLSAIGQPTLSFDERTIVFAADFKNGKGGKDLWMARRGSSNGEFDEPFNLGDSINTMGDEVFPHLRGDSVLYFSSNMHPGIGGLDIFKSRITWVNDKPVFSKPENLRTPVNSIKDDFGIIFSPEGDDIGFFSSNRKRGRGGDDIYSFVKEPVVFTISGIVKDDRTMQIVPGVQILLTGSDGSEIQTVSTTEGKFEFNKKQVFAGVNYEIQVIMEDYFIKKANESTAGLENSKNIILDFMIEPIPKEPIVLPEILYDLGKSNLKPQYQDSLQGLIRIMEENESIVIELAAHTDSRGTESTNDELSQQRAQSVVDYLIERGIEPGRLQAKGYGERVPRLILKDITRDGFLFPEGTELSEDYINNLTSRVQKEAAYQLNRRTDFRVIATNFVAGKGLVEGASPRVNIITGPTNQIPFHYVGRSKQMKFSCMVNQTSAEVVLDPRAKNVSASADETLRLLREGVIGKENFKGDVEKILADGKVKTNSIFVIDELQIGQESIYDVQVSVSARSKNPITISTKTLKEFGDYTIDNSINAIIFEE